MDSAVLATLKNSETARSLGYSVAKTSTAPLAPGALQLFCIVYNQILDPASKEAVNAIFKEEPFKQFQKKYEMLTVICQAEIIDPMIFINQQRQIVDPLLNQLGINPQSTQTLDTFKKSINDNIQSILNYIKSKKDSLNSLFSSLKFKGGKTKSKRKSKTKRKQRYVYKF